MKSKALICLLCAALILSFVGCSIGIGEKKEKDLTNLNDSAKVVYLALEKGFDKFSDKLKAIEFDVPDTGSEDPAFKLNFKLEGGIEIPSVADGVADLLKGFSLSGDIASDGSDFGVSAEVGIDAAEGTLGADLYYDDESGLYFTIPESMNDYLKIPLETFIKTDGIASGSIFGGNFQNAIDMELINEFLSAFSEMFDVYSVKIFEHIPETAFSHSEDTYTPSGSEKGIDVSKTVITLTPEDISEIIKGVAKDLSTDTETFPAFIESLLSLAEAFAKVNGETFERDEILNRINEGISEAASEGGSLGEFDSLEIAVYYTSKTFYEVKINLVNEWGESELSMHANPKIDLYEILYEHSNEDNETNNSFNICMGGKERIKGMTPFFLEFRQSNAYQDNSFGIDVDFSSKKDETKCIGNIYFLGEHNGIQMKIDAGIKKHGKETDFKFNISSIEVIEDDISIVTGELMLSSSYKQMKQADVADMAPDFSKAVDITSVEDDYMNNLMMNLLTNPVIAKIVQILSFTTSTNTMG